MKCKYYCIGVCILLQSLVLEDTKAQFVEEKLTTASNIRLTINNLGIAGNAFKGSYSDPSLRYPSCEYPAGSSIEHLFESALWIGAKVEGNTYVSTASLDNATGYQTGIRGFEFTAPLGSRLIERSSLLESPAYAPQAVSHQDFIASGITDKNTTIPGTSIQIPNHIPIGAEVHFEAYNWNYAYSDFLVILNYTITNGSSTVWDDVYLGQWINAVVRNTAKTAAGSGGSAFYNKGGVGFLEEHITSYKFDAVGDPGFTNSYIGLKFLGAEFQGKTYHPNLDTAFKVNFNSYDFSSLDNQIADNQRYNDRLASGLNYRADWQSVKNTLKIPRNSSQIVSAGPFKQVFPGESINLVFALVCARKNDDGQPTASDTPDQKKNLISNLKWAQSAYNGEDRNGNGILDPGEDINKDGKITRFLVPAPPDAPRTRIEAEPNRIRVYWSNNAENSIDPISNIKDFEGYRIFKTQVGFDLKDVQNVSRDLRLVAQFDSEKNRKLNTLTAIELTDLPNIPPIKEYDTGFPLVDESKKGKGVRLAQPLKFAGDTTTYHYMYEFQNVLDGWQQAIVVTAFDGGDTLNNIPPLESSYIANLRRVFSGTNANRDFVNGDPFVYPNPYYGSAAWEGSSLSEEDRKIMFANLPNKAEVRVYNVAGDLIYTFQHIATEGAGNARWYKSYSDPSKNVFSGGEHAWNLLSKDNQIIARGIYVFVVKDLETGNTREGKFVVIK